MSSGYFIQNLSQSTAAILHREHSSVEMLTRQLESIGLNVVHFWPEPTAEIVSADFVFYDVDMCFDEQFPWHNSQAPMPMIALVGSEAPGRLEWAMTIGMDALLLKPVGNHGIYSALLTAQRNFDQRIKSAEEIAALKEKLGMRLAIVRAINILIRDENMSETAAFSKLREMAMDARLTLESAALAYVKSKGEELQEVVRGRSV